MAASYVLRNVLKQRDIMNLQRSVNEVKCLCKLHQCSSLSQKNFEKPIKYSDSKAAKLTINDSLHLKKEKNTLWYEYYVIAGSILTFLFYFCVLHEENDIDEKLKGNPEYQSDYFKLANLTIAYHYAKRQNLPTKELEDKIEEMKRKLNI